MKLRNPPIDFEIDRRDELDAEERTRRAVGFLVVMLSSAALAGGVVAAFAF